MWSDLYRDDLTEAEYGWFIREQSRCGSGGSVGSRSGANPIIPIMVAFLALFALYSVSTTTVVHDDLTYGGSVCSAGGC